MTELIVRSGKHEGKKVVLSDAKIVIGRDEDCQIRLGSSDVSRKHCALTSTPDGLYVRDLGSRNGTYLNDVLLEGEVPLQPGDLIRVGPMVLEVPGGTAVATTAVRRGGDQGAPDIASDNDIVSWLSAEVDDFSESDTASPGDTTIIPKLPPKEAEAETQAARPGKEQAARPGKEQAKQFKSIADEAADIIRRHWERVKQEPPGQPKQEST